MLDRALRPTVRDLEATGHRVETGPVVGRAIDGQLLTDVTVDGIAISSLPVDPGAAEHEQVRSVAGFMQDALIETLDRAGRSVLWPPCVPGHTHPRELSPPGGEWPAWLCPRESGSDVPVGSL